jgi:polyhydroxybutyrate depolymerase
MVLMAALASCSSQPAAEVRPSDTPIPTATATDTDTPTPGPTLQPVSWERRITVDEVERSYILHIPPGVDSARGAPLVFVFHGAGGEPAEIQYVTGFSDISDKSGFFIVYAHGLGRTWNAGICCGYAVENNLDEKAYIEQILKDVGTIINVDPNRIYATGFSNGGGMVYRLACEMADTFAAVAAVGGTQMVDTCQPSEPVSLMHIHGLEDTIAPYAGGGEFDFRPVEETIDTWIQLNGCSGSPQVETDENVTHTRYSSCDAGTAVELHTVTAGGHSWPSRYVWDASQVIWDFFAAHPRQ